MSLRNHFEKKSALFSKKNTAKQFPHVKVPLIFVEKDRQNRFPKGTVLQTIKP